jgi:hypothetical protein
MYIVRKGNIKVTSEVVGKRFYKVTRTSTSNEVFTKYVKGGEVEEVINVMLGKIGDVRKVLNFA